MREAAPVGADEVAAFVFVGREKDYGGIHLGIPPAAGAHLSRLVARLRAGPPGRARELHVRGVPDELPRGIVGRLRHRRLTSLRLGLAEPGESRVEATGGRGSIWLSAEELMELAVAVERAAEGAGDLFVASGSGSWSDRVWCWPLET